MNQHFDECRIREPLRDLSFEGVVMKKQTHERLNENLDRLWDQTVGHRSFQAVIFESLLEV